MGKKYKNREDRWLVSPANKAHNDTSEALVAEIRATTGRQRQDAYRRLYDALFGLGRTMARRYAADLDPDEAMGIWDEALVTAVDTYDPRYRFTTWLIFLVRRRFIDAYTVANQKRHVPPNDATVYSLEDEPEPDCMLKDTVPDPKSLSVSLSAHMEVREELAAVWPWVKVHLSPVERAALVLVKVKKLGYAEAADYINSTGINDIGHKAKPVTKKAIDNALRRGTLKLRFKRMNPSSPNCPSVEVLVNVLGLNKKPAKEKPVESRRKEV